jgi:hypothetical protein
MKVSRSGLRLVAGGMMFLAMVPLAEAAVVPDQAVSCGQSSETTCAASGQATAGDGRTIQAEVTNPDAPSPAGAQEQTGQSPASQPNTQQPATAPQQPAATTPQPNGAQKPLGTAAAPYGRTGGVTASRPAGAVIAPAKQRRTRSIFIRVSIIVGAAAAVGTVVALSKGSPSRPQ